jgi:hypothetical protein
VGGEHRILRENTKSNLRQSITGVVAPITPIVPGSMSYYSALFFWAVSHIIFSAYKRYDYPWFNLYDEHLPELRDTGRFDKLRSVRQLAMSANGSTSSSRSSDLPDPAHPPYCASHSGQKSGCVFRPCGHYGCEICVGRVILGGNKCPVCEKPVTRLIGFQKPIPRTTTESGSEGDWCSIEEKIEGVQVDDNTEIGRVVTLILNEDNVSHLGGMIA